MTAVRRSDGDVDPLAVGPAFPEERVHDLHVGPLSLDDIERETLRRELQVRLSRLDPYARE